ncbi:MAG: imidazole glycerol phosphate synthase subunit HisH [Pseudomonadota bacterium]|nr:imidazole glycerol phosphate synthase subunit HisH [Pseudomonadota bacterium]
MLAVIDYGSGNLKSVSQALSKAIVEAGLRDEVVVTRNPSDLYLAERLVLPGVGAFGDCMSGLQGIPGMIDAIQEITLKEGRPFLGICVGMQLMADVGTEDGRHKGLGWIQGEVVRLPRGDWKVPHMGWNNVKLLTDHKVFKGIPQNTDFYFVHSYHYRCKMVNDCLATTDYHAPICSIVGRDNVLGVQFHPEKSQSQGVRFLKNFLLWRP